MIKLTIKTLAVTALLAGAMAATAHVNKCTGPDGRVVFSDQPCTTGQKASVINPQASAPAASSLKGATAGGADYKSRPEYPECLRLKNKLADFFGSPQYKKDPNNKGEMTVGEFMGGDKKLAEVRKDMARYKEICGVIDKEGARELEKEQAFKEKPQREAEAISRCQSMRKELKELKETIAAVAQSTDRLTAKEAQLRKQDVNDLQRRIPTLAEEIAMNCS